MRFNVIINQQKCLDFGLTASESAFMDLLNQLSSWADEIVVEGKTYYHLSRYKVLDELPFFFRKDDTVYRAFKALEDLDLIEYRKHKRKDLVRLSTKGKSWNKLGNKSELLLNSEINPSKIGNKSELQNSTSSTEKPKNLIVNSEINPTYNIYNTTNDKREIRAHEFLKENFPIRYDAFQVKFKRVIKDFDKMVLDFSCKVEIEELSWKQNVLFNRLDQFARNWEYNQSKKDTKEVGLVDLPQMKRLA